MRPVSTKERNGRNFVVLLIVSYKYTDDRLPNNASSICNLDKNGVSVRQ